jgi:hypothetical protein
MRGLPPSSLFLDIEVFSLLFCIEAVPQPLSKYRSYVSGDGGTMPPSPHGLGP